MTAAELAAQPPVTTLAVTAKAFGVGQSTMRQWAASGHLERRGVTAFKVGAQWRVVTSSLLAALGIPQTAMAGPAPDPATITAFDTPAKEVDGPHTTARRRAAQRRNGPAA